MSIVIDYLMELPEIVSNRAYEFTFWLHSKGLLYALIVRLLILPLVGFVIGAVIYNDKLGVVLAVGLIWYEGVAVLLAYAFLAALLFIAILAGPVIFN